MTLPHARTLIAEARKRRQSPYAHQRRFAHVLLSWAAAARLRYVADRIIAERERVQPDLFGLMTAPAGKLLKGEQ